MKIIKLCLAAIAGAFVTASYGANVTFKTLTCDAMQNPISVESTNPLLSWVVDADGFNRSQTAYQIIVSSSLEGAEKGKGDVWNSGKVKSDQSTFVKYEGRKLQPKQKYWWKIKIWDEAGKASEWSKIDSFEMGLMDDSEWEDAQWIALSSDNRTSEDRFRPYKASGMDGAVMVSNQSAAYFRNSINAGKEVKSARAYICGLGYYELYVNGEKSGDHVLDPAPSNYEKQTYYATYDVTEQLQKGENALGVIVGSGFYGQNISWKNNPEATKDMAYGQPAFKLLLEVTYSDGSKEEFVSDKSWKNNTGPIVFDNIYGGETFDARLEIKDWNKNSFNDSAWESAKVISPNIKKVSAQNIPPIRKIKEFSAQKIFKAPDGEWIVDFGQNIAGWVEITVNEKRGQEITITAAEILDKKGEDMNYKTIGGASGLPQVLKYICNGDGAETWEPRFTYFGFRYVKIGGLSSKPSMDSIKSILVATDMETIGDFTCSEPLFNKMDVISRYTIESNIHGIPEDCPHREKCGWLGDAHAFCEYALYNYDLLNFYKKYMEDIRTQCRTIEGFKKDGTMYQVPTMIAPGKRTSTLAFIDWGVATMYLPWYNYLHTGDKSMILEYYDNMKSLTDYYLTFKDENGIMQNGMGDWCPPRWDRKQNPDAMECDKIVSANAYFYDVLGLMQTMATMNGDDAYAQQLKVEQDALCEAFNKSYLVKIPLVNYYWYGSQTATVMALQFGMVPQDKIQSVVNGLTFDIESVKGGHHAVGIHGMRYLYTVLSKYDRADVAYNTLTIPTFPSQTYVMNYGFTTWPERQWHWEYMSEVSNSLNHPMHSGYAAYFYESLGGIQSSREKVGYREFTVDPQFPTKLTSTTVNVPTSYGNIRNSWVCKDGRFTMDLVVPFNTKARVVLSDKELESLTINGKAWREFPVKESITVIDGEALLVGSGEYKFEYNKN